MGNWEISDGKRYAMTVFQSISIVAYLSSFSIFTISLIMLQRFDEQSIVIAGILFIIGAVFASMEGFILCSVPVCFSLKKEKEFGEEEMERIEKLLDEFEVLDREENKK